MKKIVLITVALLFTTAAFAQRFDIEPKKKAYTEAEKAAIQNALAKEKKFANLEVSGTFQEGDFGEGLSIRNFWDSMPAKERAEWDRNMAELEAMTSADIPAQYSWVFDGGRKSDDMVTIEKGEVSVFMKGRSQADFTAMTALVKAHGFNLNAEQNSFGGMSFYEAKSASGASCTVLLNKNDLMVSFH